jgi:hypothetical protein
MPILAHGYLLVILLVELFANWVVERRNMINDYLMRRACIESARGSSFQGGVLILSFCADYERLL